jgi:ferrous iron transport protein A
MMLSDLCQGQRARILAIDGGRGFQQKLHLRGISEGCLVRVLSNSQGPLVLEINRSTIALGVGMAQKIRVRVMDD